MQYSPQNVSFLFSLFPIYCLLNLFRWLESYQVLQQRFPLAVELVFAVEEFMSKRIKGHGPTLQVEVHHC